VKTLRKEHERLKQLVAAFTFSRLIFCFRGAIDVSEGARSWLVSRPDRLQTLHLP